MRRLAVIGAVALLASTFGVAAAQSPAASPAASAGAAMGTVDNPRVVELAIGDGAITPAVVEVQKGETIRFNATNVNTVEVELIVGLATDVAADAGDSLKEAENIAVGASKSVDYTFDTDGPWAYGDQIDDHYAKGARGDVTFAP